MRVTDVYLSGLGPFVSGETLHLDTNDERVLFLGLSGSGKTTVLRAVIAMWLELGRCLDGRAPGLKPSGGMAMALEAQGGSALIALGGNAFFKEVSKRHPGAWQVHAQGGAFAALGGKAPAFSNMCMLDGDMEAETVSQAPWLITDDDVRAFSKAPGALANDMSQRLLDAVNGLWIGKTLEKEAGGGFVVRLQSGPTHDVRALSTGEKRMLELCYLACVQLKPGGVLLMDEPDIHLHPSQMLGLITTLENAVLEKGGQVLLASHHPDIWNRYDLLGKVIAMEGRA